MAKDNRSLGQFNLDNIPPAPRGVPQIEVTFDIDANGILSVSAKDKATGKEQKIRIEASSGLAKEEIERMKNEAAANADSDKKAREEVDKLNQADTLIFQTEKNLKEFGDKIPADKRKPIDDALVELKTAHASKNIDAIDGAIAKLNEVFTAASQDMYNASNQGGANAGGGQEQQHDGGNNNAKQGDEEVTDVDFEEVKDEKK